MPAINRSRGRNLNSFFEDRFNQQQSPFAGAGGQLGSLFGDVQRNTGGGINFGEFSEEQFRLSRDAALSQFFNPQTSEQQNDAIGSVTKNRIARGLRGRAAENAGEQTRQRFLEGNQRAALDFIKQDLNRGLNTDANSDRNNTANLNLPGNQTRGLTVAESDQVSAQIGGANTLSRFGEFEGGGLLDAFVGNPQEFQGQFEDHFNDFDRLGSLLGLTGKSAGFNRPGAFLQNTIEQETRAQPDSAPEIGSAFSGVRRASRRPGLGQADQGLLATNLFSPFQF